MGKGLFLGLQYLEEGEYALNGGRGNKVLSEFEVKDGQLFVNGEKDATVPPTMYEFLQNRSSCIK